MKGLSENLNRILKNSDDKIAFYYTKTVGNLFSKLKSQTPKSSQSKLIYKIDCRTCDSCYVGQTKQYLKRRIQNHKQDCAEKYRNKREKTALATHHFDLQHEFDLEEVTILDFQRNLGKRLILEELYINTTKTTVNIKNENSTINLIYKNII